MPGLKSGKSESSEKFKICERRITPLKSTSRSVSRMLLRTADLVVPRTVTLTEQVFRRIPASVLGEELRNEIAESPCILVDAVECLLLVLSGESAEAGAGGVHKDQIADVEQAVIVVHHAIGRGGSVAVVGGDDALRPECSHVKPHRRRSGSPVVEEGDRTGFALVVRFEIGHVEHAGLGGLVLIIFVGVLWDVVPIPGMHDQRARERIVVNNVAADGDRSLAGLLFRFEFFRALRLGLGRFRLGCWRFLFYLGKNG